MKAKILKKILLLILGIIIAFVSGELILRARGVLSLGFNTYDRQTGLVILPPNSAIRQKTSCIDNVIRANSQGFHDSEFNLVKPKDTFRIAVLGDSFIEARHVPIEKSFQFLLEEKLNENPAKTKKIEIYSFGKGGGGTFQNYLYLNQYALKYKPDLVILAFLPANDFRDDYEVLSKIFDEKGQIRNRLSSKQRLMTKSVLLVWLQYKWQVVKTNEIGNYFRRIFLSKNSAAQVPLDFQVYLKDYPKTWSKIWDLEKKLLTEFKRTVENNKNKFLLISINDIWRTNPELIEKDEALSQIFGQFEFDFTKPERILSELAESESITYLNLMPIFKERVEKEKNPVFVYCGSGRWDGHWNETGNLWAAEFASQFLSQGQGRELLNR